MQGFLFDNRMDILYEAAAKYLGLEQSEYKFILSRGHKHELLHVHLTFRDIDFYHLTGVQHIDDISIPRNRKKTLDNILFHKTISTELLMRSNQYTHPLPNLDIPKRIEELRYLEQYLDIENDIKIYVPTYPHSTQSMINADYLISSRIPKHPELVYIFLKKRDYDETYRVVSFSPKGTVSYSGITLYWMSKEKITSGITTTLYRLETPLPTLPKQTSEEDSSSVLPWITLHLPKQEQVPLHLLRVKPGSCLSYKSSARQCSLDCSHS